MDYRDRERGVYMLLPDLYHVIYFVGEDEKQRCELEIPAYSDEEAQYRLKQIKKTGKVVAKSSFNHPDYVSKN